jgi:hypothetical protein
MNHPDEPNPLRDHLAALPRELPPARDLWPEIRARLGAQAEPAFRAGLTRAERGFHRRYRLPLAIAAAVALAAGLQWARPMSFGPSWAVAPLAGNPQLNRATFTGRAQLHEGGWLETDGSSRAQVDVGTIGEVRLEPNSRLRLVKASPTDHRIELAQGKMSALIWAPPRLFFVQTPSATAIDLGCAYTLTVDDRGAGLLEVTAGYVALEHGGLESIIPAGLMCRTRPGMGPGTPFSVGAAPELRDALDRFDTGDDGAVRAAIAAAREGDGVTLWHLLARAPAAARGAIYDKLALLHPPPPGVTRPGILAEDPVMRDRWADELGLLVASRPGS